MANPQSAAVPKAKPAAAPRKRPTKASAEAAMKASLAAKAEEAKAKEVKPEDIKPEDAAKEVTKLVSELSDTPKMASAPEANITDEQREGERRAEENATAASRRATASMQFAVSQLAGTLETPPAALAEAAKQAEAKPESPGLVTPKAITAEFLAKLEALKKECGVTDEFVIAPATGKAKAADKAPAADKDAKNGITRPADGTKCGRIWAAADQISASQHSIAAIAVVKHHELVKNIPDATIKTQYARWRQYNGIKGRLQTITARKTPEGVYDEALPVNH